MTKHAYQQSVFSGSDTVAVAPFAQITVTNASDDSAASIWSDAAGANPIADGVLLADENGYFIFYADEGTYNIAILSDGISKTLENVEIGAGNPYSGVFKGSWNMSSGTYGPAAPATDYQTTHTATTVTPDSHLTSSPALKLAAAASEYIPILGSGTASASIINPGLSGGDTVFVAVLYLVNSAVTAQHIEQILNGTTPAEVWFAGAAITTAYDGVQFAACNDSVVSYGDFAPVFAAESIGIEINYATGQITTSANGIPTGTPLTLNLSEIPTGQGLRLISGVMSVSADVMFSAGSLAVNFSDTTDVIPSVGLPVDDLFDFSADLVGGTYTLTPSPYGAVYHAVATTTSTDYAGGWCATENRYNGNNPLYTYFGFCNVEMTASDIDDIFAEAMPGTFALLIYAHTDTDNDVYYGGRGPGGWLGGSATDGKQHPDGGLVYFRCRDDGAGSFVLEIRVDGVVTTLLTASNSGISGMKPFIYANYVYGTQTIGQVFFAG